MNRSRATTRERALAWALAPLFLLVLDAAITRTPVLWARTSFEESDLTRLNFSQTYQTAREIYGPDPGSPLRIAVIGNSRARLGLRRAPLEEALADSLPDRSLRVSNLSIFGAGPTSMEVIGRHLDQIDPALTIVAMSPSDLAIPPDYERNHPALRLLARGIGDDGLGNATASQRIDRWVRSLWRLFRFREFVQAALRDRIRPMEDGAQPPERFVSTARLFEATRPGVGAEVEARYRAFLRAPGLPSFLAYLRVGQRPHIEDVKRRVRDARSSARLDLQSSSLSALLDRSASSRKALLVLLPENPILADDLELVFHDPELDRQGLARIRAASLEFGVDLIDARNWMGPDAFIDLDHLLPDLSGFERRIAPEILRAL